MLLTLLPRAWPIVLGAALRIKSEVDCPNSAEVSNNLQNVLDLSQASADALEASIRRDGDWLVLGLTGTDGTSLGERRLAAVGDCATLSHAAAVVFAAWLSNEHPEFLVALPTEGPAPDEAPSEPAAPPPSVESSPATAPPPVVPSKPPPKPSPSQPAPTPAPVGSARRRFELGAGLTGAASSAPLAPGVELSAAWAPPGRGFGARVGMALLGARSEPLGAGAVSWTRWPLLVGPFLRLRAGSSSLDLEVGGALGWARLRGDGFESSTTDSGLTVGGYAALRFVLTNARLRPFVMAAPLYWFRGATAVATDATSAAVSRELPAFEALLSLGAQWPL